MKVRYANLPPDAPPHSQWHWCIEDAETLLFLRREGVPGPEIAEILGRSRHTVYRNTTRLLKDQEAEDSLWANHRCAESGCWEAWVQIQREAGVA